MFAEIIQPSPEDYKARRARLGIDVPTPRKLIRIAAPEPEVNPEPIVVPEPVFEENIEPEEFVPLNMLAPPSWKFILAYVCLKHRVTQKAVLSNRRNRFLLVARYEAIALIYSHQKRSMPEIGKMFNRDHTVILHALRKTGIKKMPADLPETHKSAPSEVFTSPQKPHRANPQTASGRTALQQAIKRGYASGVSCLDIAEAYGCSPKSIYVIAHRMGLQHPSYNRSPK